MSDTQHKLLTDRLEAYIRSLRVEMRLQHEAGEYARVETLDGVCEELRVMVADQRRVIAFLYTSRDESQG